MSPHSHAPSSPPLWRRSLAPLVVFFVFLVSHLDRLYLYGDDINNLSPGRPFPLPDYGHYIGGRVVDSFFNGFAFQTFETFLAPLLGLTHIIDVHSAHATFMFALVTTALAWVLFAYVRLFVALDGWMFIPFALCAQVFVLGPIELDAVTGISAYTVPLVLSLLLLLPLVRLAVFGEDALAAAPPWTRTIGVGLLTYLVAFSLTNVELFTALAVAGTGLVVLFTRARAAGRGFGARALWAAYRELPGWTQLVGCLLPLLIGVAVFFDVTSGRFLDEQQRAFGAESFAGPSLWRGLNALPLSSGPVLDFIAKLTLAAGALLWVIRLRRGEPGARRFALLGAILAPICLMYALFLQRVSQMGGKDYFAKDGLNTYLVIVAMLPVVGGLFALARARLSSIPAAFLIFVVAFTGLRQLEQTPTREVTKAEMKGLFDSLYMSYCYGEPRVPIVLRHGQLGWPYAPDGEGWYLDTFWKVFREHVIGYGGAVDDGYQPTFELVPTVEALYERVAAMQRARPLLRVGAERSPYWIDAHERLERLGRGAQR
ncbi:MAG: hypothetical protein R3F49_05020 [Planctomycetota bacterium]